MNRLPPRTLLEKLLQESDFTIEEWVNRFAVVARSIGEDVTLSARQLQRWASGQVIDARPAARRVAARLWKHPFTVLVAPLASAVVGDNRAPEPVGRDEQARWVHPSIEVRRWSALANWLTPSSSGASEVRALRAAVDGVLLRRVGRAPEAVAVLGGADEGLPEGSVTGHLVRLHLAHALRNTGEYRQAAEHFEGLIGGEFDEVARYWLCDHEFLKGRFRAALAQLRTAPSHNAIDEGERLRLIGHIERVNARFDDAVDTYRAALDLARAEGLVAAEAKALANLAQTVCWSGDVDAVKDATARARALLDLVPNAVERVKLRAAEATCLTLVGDISGAAAAIEDTRRLANDIGYRGGQNLADVAQVLLDVHSGNPHRARRSHDELDQRTRACGGNAYWVPITLSWLDGANVAVERAREFDWLDDPGDTLSRWAALAGR